MADELLKRVMPNNVEAEQSVIGAMLMDRDAITIASEILTVDDFYQKQYGILFEAMVELYTENSSGRFDDPAKPAEGEGCAAGDQQPGICPGY